MKLFLKTVFVLAAAAMLAAPAVSGKEIRPMFGGWLTAGYDWSKKPVGPKGSVAYDEKKNQFKGSYTGLAMPPGRRAIFAWLHDTVNQKTTYLGPVGWLKKGTGGQDKGRFAISLGAKYKGGNFGSNEILAFSSEKTGALNGRKVVQRPSRPSGNKAQNPAFYLFAALPGADTNQIYCGHGLDFAFVKAPEKQRCYD